MLLLIIFISNFLTDIRCVVYHTLDIVDVALAEKEKQLRKRLFTLNVNKHDFQEILLY